VEKCKRKFRKKGQIGKELRKILKFPDLFQTQIVFGFDPRILSYLDVNIQLSKENREKIAFLQLKE